MFKNVLYSNKSYDNLSVYALDVTEKINTIYLYWLCCMVVRICCSLRYDTFNNIQLIWFEIFDNKTDAFNRERNFKLILFVRFQLNIRKN